MLVSVIVCEEVCNQGNIFDDGKNIVNDLNADEIKDIAKHPDQLAELEERVKGWMKALGDILKESDQIRRESDDSGKDYFLSSTSDLIVSPFQNISEHIGFKAMLKPGSNLWDHLYRVLAVFRSTR